TSGQIVRPQRTQGNAEEIQEMKIPLRPCGDLWGEMRRSNVFDSDLVFHLRPALLAELRLPFQFSPASLATQLRIHRLAAFRAELTVRESAAIRARYADDRLRVSRVGHRVDRRA